MTQYQNAKCYYEQHGHLKVPVAYLSPDGRALGKWVSRQRTAKEKLSPDRVKLLNQIGMVWGNDPWQHRYELALVYKEKHGTTQIPTQYKTADGIWLGKWMYLQRKEMQKEYTVLSTDQQEKMQQLLMEAI